jgi:hypothetical protein
LPALRRPRLGTILGALALFVALGGPAEAARLINGSRIASGSVTARAIKPGTLTGRLVRAGSVPGDRLRGGSVAFDRLSAQAVALLQATPPNEVTGAKVMDRTIGAADLAGDSVGQAEIARDGVGATELAEDTVDSDEIVDGRLTVNDLASFAGQLTIDMGSIPARDCASYERAARLLSPRPNVTIADDAVLVTASQGLDDHITLAARPSGADTIRFVACNVSGAAITPGAVTLRYLTIEF